MKLKLRAIIIGLLGVSLVAVMIVRGCRQPETKGKQLYEQHCGSCHGENGKGFFGYPTVAGSDYMNAHKDEIACIIYYGMEGAITVNGKEYDQRMIGNPDLSPVEIANISNYMYNNFNNDPVDFNSDEIMEQLENCDREIVK